MLAEAQYEYNLYYVDLEKRKKGSDKDEFNSVLLFSYSKEEVDNKHLIDIHIRANSSKEKINMNKKLIAFFLHKGCLYQWT